MSGRPETRKKNLCLLGAAALFATTATGVLMPVCGTTISGAEAQFFGRAQEVPLTKDHRMMAGKSDQHDLAKHKTWLRPIRWISIIMLILLLLFSFFGVDAVKAKFFEYAHFSVNYLGFDGHFVNVYGTDEATRTEECTVESPWIEVSNAGKQHWKSVAAVSHEEHRDEKKHQNGVSKEELVLSFRTNALGVDLVGCFPSEENVFISPWSIQVALAMTAVGSTEGSDCEREFCTLLGATSAKHLKKVVPTLQSRLASSGICKFLQANGLWVEKGSISQKYLENVSTAFSAAIAELDGRAPINNFVEDATQGMIKEILLDDPKGPAVLVNAVYFRGNWKYQFDKSATRPATFWYSDNGSQKKVSMMQREFKGCEVTHIQDIPLFGETSTKATSQCDVLVLPYENDDDAPAYNAVFILPSDKAQTPEVRTDIEKVFNAFALDLSNEKSAIHGAIYQDPAPCTSGGKVRVSIPRFKVDFGIVSLKEQLKQLGLKNAFDPNTPGKFDIMAGRAGDNLFIEDVVHKAVVEVDEEGTVAAAATAVKMTRSLQFPISKFFRVDRPFLFGIQNAETKAFAFFGKVCNPDSEAVV